MESKAARELGRIVAESKLSKRAKTSKTDGLEVDVNLPCPGSKIRSRGMGRGLGKGMGMGPVGMPIGRKLDRRPVQVAILGKGQDKAPEVKKKKASKAAQVKAATLALGNPKDSKGLPCPGSKIRSKGLGRGLGRGGGKGPVGAPVGAKGIDPDIEKLPEQMQGKAYEVKKKVPKPGFPKASAREDTGLLDALGAVTGGEPAPAQPLPPAATLATAPAPGAAAPAAAPAAAAPAPAPAPAPTPVAAATAAPAASAKVARELGKLTAENQILKKADEIIRSTFEKVATAIGKEAGLSNADIEDLIKEAQGYGMPGMGGGYFGGGYFGGYPGTGGGYGGYGSAYGPQQGYGMGGQPPGGRSPIPGVTQEELKAPRSWSEWWQSPGLLGTSESAGQRYKRRVKEYGGAFGMDPKAMGKRLAGGGALGGGGAGGGGGGGLYEPSVMRMAARGGWDPRAYGQQMNFARDLAIGGGARQAVGRAFRNIFNQGTGMF